METLLAEPMSNAVPIRSPVEAADAKAAGQLLPLVYEELRKLAAARLALEQPGQTLQATALVHEAYLRLTGCEAHQLWRSRDHFFGAAAEAMRRILVERARRKGRQKRGGDLKRTNIDEVDMAFHSRNYDVIDLDVVLTRFAEIHPEKAKLIQLRYFGGMTVDEAAGMLGISPATADRWWTYARAWLYRALSENGAS